MLEATLNIPGQGGGPTSVPSLALACSAGGLILWQRVGDVCDTRVNARRVGICLFGVRRYW